ncbi:hypothetical protein OWM54_14555 [Myxococcus sp. MISCRS1]|jgi:hypothetical protein|uniref:Uncharacterized protein n=1 Tax=Myxococcus llanfairpwllgwyngyllgogerychwyrndrobwllllantysiliogogogochensis TaxID=2590453 RepID=A0A540WL67_9BACT|nr:MULTISPECIES: hypothetical protein [Myxococcaceae]MBZ4329709.1 hypothetical protein [Corallococcus sp. AS-1-12]MBZ4400640.1 hypothetical protein [Myxococcus sp. AS-1-15]MCY0998353.1 hypothetical protein [Myxococcus sp. MISCRS1]TQF09769.1 hypothetical protein FJV41_42870 [Myxococcus llanfairpwllgwyngyllgogerychwyrndrobwllllantysiliogogogochensis]
MSATAIPFHVIPMKVIDFSNAKLSLDLGKSRYGTAQPQLDIFLPPSATHRQMSALLHAFAASLELSTPASERWIVQSERLSEPNHGRIYLELAEGDHAEAMRGMMLLNTLLG